MFFQYYSVIIFLVSAAVLIGVSYATEPPSGDHIAGLTYAGVSSAQRRASRASWNHWDVINSSIVLLLILGAYIYFSG
jgi:SSS family solute:Na+ symporter